MANLNLKIGLLAPTKGGKTTLLATTLQEISGILKGNTFGARYSAADRITKEAIQRKLAEYKSIFALKDPFAVPRMEGSIEIEDYKFSLNVPTGNGEAMRLRLWFKDFPGGMIGEEIFEDEVGPFLNEANAMIVPIASDFLMAWHDTVGKADPALMEKNIAAQISLEADSILSILADWIARRVNGGERPYLAFAPIRCEAYFNDNGGVRDESEKLFKAVQECFVKPLIERLDENEVDAVKIELHAIDTYGIVELAETKVLKDPSGNPQLESTFMRRINPAAQSGLFASKGSFALLTRLLNYQMDEMASGLGIRRRELQDSISNRNMFMKILFSVFSGVDKKRQELAKVMAENDTLIECIAKFGELAPPDSLRQRIVRDNGETLVAPSQDIEAEDDC